MIPTTIVEIHDRRDAHGPPYRRVVFDEFDVIDQQHLAHLRVLALEKGLGLREHRPDNYNDARDWLEQL